MFKTKKISNEEEYQDEVLVSDYEINWNKFKNVFQNGKVFTIILHISMYSSNKNFIEKNLLAKRLAIE